MVAEKVKVVEKAGPIHSFADAPDSVVRVKAGRQPLLMGALAPLVEHFKTHGEMSWKYLGRATQITLRSAAKEYGLRVSIRESSEGKTEANPSGCVWKFAGDYRPRKPKPEGVAKAS